MVDRRSLREECPVVVAFLEYCQVRMMPMGVAVGDAEQCSKKKWRGYRSIYEAIRNEKVSAARKARKANIARARFAESIWGILADDDF